MCTAVTFLFCCVLVQVNTYAHNIVQGMIALLHNCPQEVAHLRRELLIAARHILATDLRNRFVSCIDQLFDENLLIGGGWTTRETVRSLAYSILADLVHHIRGQLSLPQLALAVQVRERYSVFTWSTHWVIYCSQDCNSYYKVTY